ncbi:DUF5916 domain-containing protein [Fodinibius sediminis]|uniref:Carbohydrate family 9 binding domain-like n=1 Tax=Fodinibius sediminis TaxID=1214077 RepID=A0A521BEB5_9BACT|nr:DUF5916 domain-containing protein [Fodinibius sediminis]SMO45412.1 Carbohydrate family 9 binding domain-like [Fodinibius sediminis]
MSFLKLAFPVLLLLTQFLPLHAQKVNDSYQLHIREINSPITIDGKMDERAWQQAEVATDFHMITPMDTSDATLRTDVRMAYDDKNLYLIAINFKGESDPNVVESLRRDFNFGNNDNFLLFMDPFDDQTNGFSFGANAEGAEWDGLMYDGGSVNLSWDNKWVSKVANYEDRWVFEAAIPFKSLRYDEDITKWGINFSRYDLTFQEKSGWAPVPRQFPSASLAYTGNLIWDKPPPAAGSNISVIPHVLGGASHDYQGSGSTSYRREAGVNAKIGISSSLNLDLTVNPDFSQVEVDEQIIDTERFELFFPEKRQFFLENEDLFANFGTPTIRPFFSRRIGLEAPIIFGGRLSGQLNRNWRLGVMNMQTERVDAQRIPSQNFSVFALKRRVADRSNLGLIFVNKESLGELYQAEDNTTGAPRYNRNVGIEYDLATANNLWNGNFTLLKSFSSQTSGRTFSHSTSLLYSDGNWEATWAHDYVGEDFTAETGYVPRKGYIRTYPEVGYLFFPSTTSILSHGPTISTSYYFSESFRNTDYENKLTYNLNFRNGNTLNGWVSNQFVELINPFDPTNASGYFLEAGTRHHWKNFGLEFTSKPQSLYTYGFSVQKGGFFADGERFYATTQLGYRFQPYVNISAHTSYNHLNLPKPWNQTDFWLIGTRLDITFTKNIYFTTFTQYNEQLDNVNINSRFQWRFQPASDLFIVYTDNYLPGLFSVKTRSLMVKFTYWWNL